MQRSIRVVGLLLLLVSAPALAQQPRMWNGGPDLTSRPPENTTPKLLSNVGFDQHLGEKLPLDLPFMDESGARVTLGSYFGKRPVIVAFVYYECPMLCTEVLNGLTGSLTALDLSAGRDFDVVAISFDPRDSAPLATLKKANYVNRYHRAGAEAGWHFLTGDTASILAATRAAGFRFIYDSVSHQFAHASGIVVATPEGTISKYFFGVEYAPKEMKYALMDASHGSIGTLTDKFLLFCYHYDPTRTRNGATIVNLIRFAGGATIVALIMMFIVLNSVRRKRLVQMQLEGTGVTTSLATPAIGRGGRS